MQSFIQHTQLDEALSKVTYEQYTAIMEGRLDEGIIDFAVGLKKDIAKVFAEFKDEIQKLIQEFGDEAKDIAKGFATKKMFYIFRAFKFSVKAMTAILVKVAGLWRESLGAIFEEMAKSGIMKKIQSGAMKIDEVLAKYPILKKISGPLVAGLLIYIWLNMSFIGDPQYDLDFMSVFGALGGNFSLADLFTGKSGLMLITLFSTGGFISAPWLGNTAANIVLALMYTALTAYKKNHPVAVRLRNKLKMVRVRA